MAETSGRRVLIEDERRDGTFLRVTWHDDERLFVVSTWDGTLCVSAVRVGVDRAPDLLALLANGMADAAARPVEVPAPPAAGRQTLVQHVRTWWRQRTALAAVHELSHARARRADKHRRSA